MIAAAFIATGAVLDPLGAFTPGYDVVWFHPILLHLGIFWFTLSLLVGILRDRVSSDASVFRLTTWRSALSRHVPLSRVARYLSIALLLPPFISTYAGFKRSIPSWNNFRWDQTFYELDRLIHGGSLPSELFGELATKPGFTVFLDQGYYLWFPVLILTVTWFAWAESSVVRNQFLVSFFLTWILLGVATATLLSSAGPCYYQHLVPGPDPYSELMAYLRQTSEIHELTALRAQDLLWTGYATNKYPTEGISAMPSIHVAMAALFSIAGLHVHRFLGFAYMIFLGWILVGSVLLGWHYAIDGYVSIILVALVWRLSGALVSRPGCR